MVYCMRIVKRKVEYIIQTNAEFLFIYYAIIYRKKAQDSLLFYTQKSLF